MTDIDIDFKDRIQALEKINFIQACTYDRFRKRHNTGVYFQNIPHDIDKLSTIPYKQAEEQGYFKIDFLNVSVYSCVRDETHLQSLMDTEPVWDILKDRGLVEKEYHINGQVQTLFQLSNNWWVLEKHSPENIHQLAQVLALIRPAKNYLVGSSWKVIEKEIWEIPKSGYFWKKSHAYAYATLIKVQMNLIVEALEYS